MSEKGDRMYTRKTGFILIVLIGFVASAIGYYALATASSKGGFHPPEFLSQESLKGSMQGSSGIAVDLNGDGNEDLVIGAPYSKFARTQGSLLVYLTSSKGLQNRSPILLQGEGNHGWSLVALGDLDHDGRGYFAAGAINASGQNASLCGTVTIYKGGNRPHAVTILEGENALDRFGYALASGDLNGDGYPDLIVSAPMHSPSPSLYQQGAVYVYFGPDYDPSKRVKILPVATGPITGETKGIGLSLATGDLTNDGTDDLLIGAGGKAIAYYGGPSFPSESPDATFTSGERRFGNAVAVLFDVDGDGFGDVAVGAPQAPIGGVTDCGRLYILKGGGTGTVNADVASPSRLAVIDGEPGSRQFGSTILPIKDGMNRDYVLVSAVHADSVSTQERSRHNSETTLPMTGRIYLMSSSDLNAETPVSSLLAFPGVAKDMHLGFFLTVAEGIWGKWLAAGAPTENRNIGRVRLFDLNNLDR